MALANSFQLPQELYDAIIECQQDDTQALRALALVNRQWLEICRVYLFSTVCIDCRKRTPEAIDELFTLLPAVARHVRGLHLAGYMHNQVVGNDNFEPDHLMFKHLGSMLPIVGPNIIRLVFTQCQIGNGRPTHTSPSSPGEDIMAFFSRVQILHLHNVNFESFAHLRWYIDSCTALQELQLDRPSVFEMAGSGTMVCTHSFHEELIVLLLTSTFDLGMARFNQNVDQTFHAFTFRGSVAPSQRTAQEIPRTHDREFSHHRENPRTQNQGNARPTL
jgi:hypothetical protein